MAIQQYTEDESDCDCLSIVCHHVLRRVFPMIHCIPNKIDVQIHNELMRYPLLNIVVITTRGIISVSKVGKQYTLELSQIVHV